jgi:predicted AAA+ superfamily ATPase
LKNLNLYYRKNISGSEIDFVVQDLFGSLIPIEVKSNDKDNIPKIFKSFDLKYQDRIKFFIRTTKSLVKIRDLN